MKWYGAHEILGYKVSIRFSTENSKIIKIYKEKQRLTLREVVILRLLSKKKNSVYWSIGFFFDEDLTLPDT